MVPSRQLAGGAATSPATPAPLHPVPLHPVLVGPARLRRRLVPSLIPLLLVCLLTGCSGAATSASAAPVTTNQVTMAKSYRFDPVTIKVRTGETVTWRNDDNFTHSVFLQDGSGRNPVAAPGQSVSITFDKPGEYTYTCSFHPQNMKGKVVVES